MKSKLPVTIETKMLRSIIKDRGIRLGKIASVLGMKYSTLAGRIEGKTPFTTAEINAMCNILRLDETVRDEIFF